MPYVLLYKALCVLKVEKRQSVYRICASTFYHHYQSSLLSSILGELPAEKGVLRVKGQLTYAAQQPWVFPGTIRSNILFGKELNPQKYERVIRACALKRVRDLHLQFTKYSTIVMCMIEPLETEKRVINNSKVALDLVLLFCFFQ